MPILRSFPRRPSAPLVASVLALVAATGVPGARAQQRPPATAAQPAQGVAATIAARTGGMERRDGLLPLWTDARTGRLYLEVPRDSTRVLMFVSQATGLGSNPIGIDRGASGTENVARFDRDGERVLVVLENWSYRSSDLANRDHQRTIAEAFPQSTVAALPLLADEGGRLLVDATEFVQRDWLDVAGTLQRGNQGQYAVDRPRSSVAQRFTKAFPDNTEIGVNLTFAASGRPGSVVSNIVPDGRAFTLRQHISFVRLPDERYRPRPWDPRTGYFGITFRDYAQPIQRPLEQRWISRHRIERQDPADPRSPIVKPIVYHVDRGIPEPLRTATLEGARFWVEAFDRAGLQGGFRVELLPEDADPMDVRYNVVQWINRHERGWSVGGSLGDPRTGEILKGMARMDSHRARTDYNLYAGLMGADAAAADTAFVLARVRQVTAHEIGHTLGLGHNYIASTYERGSLMDYPPPRVRLGRDGTIDIAQAYDVGPGEFDVWAIRWGYGVFPAAAESDSLQAIVKEGLAKGYLYLSDADARPESASDPRTNLWDDAATAAEFFGHQTAVRRVAMGRFGERSIRPGDPLGMLEERFAPVYFMHRFAIASLAKAIGGMEYSNAVRGDGQQVTRPVSAERQREALRLLLGALAPKELAIPDTVLTLLGPGAAQLSPPVELFGRRTRPAFDELGAARTLSQMIVDAVLQRERLARLVQFASRGERPLTVDATMDALIDGTMRAPGGEGAKEGALRRVTQRAVVDRLIALAADDAAAPEVRAMANWKLRELRGALRSGGGARAEVLAHRAHMAGDIDAWLERGEAPKVTPALVAPPGDPFGMP